MSFHRNHTATVRSQVENTSVSHVENEYSQPPRNSHVSAYAGKRQPTLPGRKAAESTGLVIAQRRDAPGERGLSLPFDSGHSRVWNRSSLNGPQLAPPPPETVSHSAREEYAEMPLTTALL